MGQSENVVPQNPLTAVGDWEASDGGLFHWTWIWFGLLGLAGIFWPLAFWIAGHSHALVWLVLSVLVLVRGVALVGMWDTSSVCCAAEPSVVSQTPQFWNLCVTFFGQMRLAQQQCHGWKGGWIWTCTTARQKAGSRLRCSRSGVRLSWWLTVMLVLQGNFRVGEASHPGPSRTDCCWHLGVANPSGLNGKLDQVNHMGGDVWLLSETQLSQHGVAKFHKGLKMLKSPWRYAVAGAPCSMRSRTDTGNHSGVMVLSKMPARALAHDFSGDAYTSARVQVVGLAVADVWVTLGVLYGVPCNAQHKQARFQTDALLADLVDRVACQATGPRAIGGDFNFGPTELQQLDRLRALGFREVQDLRAWRFGISAEATGRGARRIDQLWISPELQRVYQGTVVSFDQWADHATVCASFAHEGLSVSVAAWPTPSSFPWPTEWTCQLDVECGGDLTSAYAQFWNQVEGQAKCWSRHHGVPVSKHQCGRGGVLDTTPTRTFLCPVKKARKGDVQPTFHGVSLQHARFFRQLRRLQSLARILQKGVSTWTSQINRDETWRAVRMAVGFPGGFGPWWTSNGLVPKLSGPLPLCSVVLLWILPGLSFMASKPSCRSTRLTW